jgi:hypothetical protein
MPGALALGGPPTPHLQLVPSAQATREKYQTQPSHETTACKARSHVRMMCQLLVMDADENGGSGVAGRAAGEEPGTAAAEAEFLDQLCD